MCRFFIVCMWWTKRLPTISCNTFLLVPPPTKRCCIPDPLLGLWDDVCWSDWTVPFKSTKKNTCEPSQLWCNDLGISGHTMDTMQEIAWEDAEVLASNPCPHQCCVEPWHIPSQPLPMNREASLLPPVCNGLINWASWSSMFSSYIYLSKVYVSNCRTLPVYVCV